MADKPPRTFSDICRMSATEAIAWAESECPTVKYFMTMRRLGDVNRPLSPEIAHMIASLVLSKASNEPFWCNQLGASLFGDCI